MDPTDLQLLRAWQEGDTASGNELYQRYFSTVRRYFANKVDSERDVEDLVHGTFLAVIEGRQRFEGRSSFRTWLLGIAHNLLREHYRKGRRESGALDFSEISVRDLCDGPSTLLGNLRDQQVLLEALRAISLDNQVVLELYYWEHFTGPELGQFFGVSEAAARGRLRRAKEQLMLALSQSPLSPRTLTSEDDLDRWAAEVRALAFADDELPHDPS